MRRFLELLDSHLTLSRTKQLHALITTTSPSSSAFLTTKLLRLYAVNHDLASARILFDQSPERSVYLWNSMIRAFAREHDFCNTFSLFFQMRAGDVKPDNYTFACILRACAEKPDCLAAKMAHGSVILSGLASDHVISSSLVSAYSKLGIIEEATSVFNGVTDPDLVLWNSLLSGYRYGGSWQEGLDAFRRMRNSDILPDGYSLVGLISCFWDPSLLRIGRGIHGICVKGGYEFIAHVRSVLVSMYSRCNCFESAHKILCSLLQPDLVTWSAMITGLSLVGKCENALMFFTEMNMSGKKPDAVLVASVLSACASLASVRPGREIHAFVFRHWTDLDVAVSCALMDMYAKGGFKQFVFQVLKMMPMKTLTTYNVVISSLGSHGLGHIAIEIFEEMLDKGFKPDNATFSALLCACSHSGLLKEGRVLFRRMQDEFRVEMQMEHYLYMVKLLGMDGELQEAFHLIETMPMFPDSGVWGALLWSCCTHGHLELAESVAQRLFAMEPRKTAYRVMLSNMYAAKGMWGDAYNLRDEIMAEGSNKIPGISWISSSNTRN